MHSSDWQYTGIQQGGISRVIGRRSVTLLLCILVVTVCGVSAVSQISASQSAADAATMQTVPLGSDMMSEELLRFAAATSARALSDEAAKHYYDAALKYESILAAAEKPTVPGTAAVHMMKAAANIDAARTRFYYGTTLDKSAALYENNHALISSRLAGAQAELAETVEKKNLKSLNLVGWSCDASKLNAQSYYLQGMLNKTPGDLDKSISRYKYVAQCEPAVKSQVDTLTAYIEGVRANMAHSPLSSGEIMKDISGTLHLLGLKGDAVSLVVQRVYDSHQAHQTPPPIAVR